MTDLLPIQLNRVDWHELHVILHDHHSPAVTRLLCQIREQARRPREQFRTRYRIVVSEPSGELFRIPYDEISEFRKRELDGDDLCAYYQHVANIETLTFVDPIETL